MKIPLQARNKSPAQNDQGMLEKKLNKTMTYKLAKAQYWKHQQEQIALAWLEKETMEVLKFRNRQKGKEKRDNVDKIIKIQTGKKWPIIVEREKRSLTKRSLVLKTKIWKLRKKYRPKTNHTESRSR